MRMRQEIVKKIKSIVDQSQAKHDLLKYPLGNRND